MRHIVTLVIRTKTEEIRWLSLKTILIESNLARWKICDVYCCFVCW